MVQGNFQIQKHQHNTSKINLLVVLFFGAALLSIAISFSLIYAFLPDKLSLQQLSDHLWGKPLTSFEQLHFYAIKRIFWIACTTFIAGIGFSVAGILSQTLTQNSIADPTTLGISEATVFSIIFMKIVFFPYVSSHNYQYFYLLSALIGSGVVLFCTSLIINKTWKGDYKVKVIIIGLSLNILFRVLVFLLKNFDVDAVKSSFLLSIGGAENTYTLYPSQFSILGICAIGVLGSFAMCLWKRKEFNLLEFGAERCKSMGININQLKYLLLFLMLLCTSLSIVLVGNVAFLGLLGTHAARMIFNTRKYSVIVPISSLIATFLLSIGVVINFFTTIIPSSIVILFFGSIALVLIVLKN